MHRAIYARRLDFKGKTEMHIYPTICVLIRISDTENLKRIRARNRADARFGFTRVSAISVRIIARGTWCRIKVPLHPQRLRRERTRTGWPSEWVRRTLRAYHKPKLDLFDSRVEVERWRVLNSTRSPPLHGQIITTGTGVYSISCNYSTLGARPSRHACNQPQPGAASAILPASAPLR